MKLSHFNFELPSKLLKLDKNYTVHCGMAIGYANDKNKVNNLKTEREMQPNEA